MLLGLKYRAAVDWWAIGIVMYEMMVGQNSFQSLKKSPYGEKILKNHVSYPRWLTSSAVSVVSKGGKYI